VAELAAPATELSMQDYVDTIRKQEDSFQGMGYLKLINASGKEDLGDGLLNAITVAGQDVQLAFQPRTDTAQDGTVTTGSGPANAVGRQTFTDTSADFVTANIQAGSFCVNWADRSIADVVRVIDADTLETRALVNGTDNEWEVGDDYSIWNIVQCRTFGGNNIAVDSADQPINAILPTAFTQVIVQLSSANTITNLESLESQVADIHGQVQRHIFVDTEELVNGNGYQQTPFNNWSDAVDAAETQSLRTIYVETDSTVDRQLKNFEIQGIDLPTIDLNGQIFDGTIIRECNVTGTQGVGTGDLLILTSAMSNVTNFRGAALTVSMFGTISFQNNANVLINNIVPAVAGSQVTIDMNSGSTPAVTLQNCTGDYLITNMDDAGDLLVMTMLAGTVTIDASCVDGSLTLSGHAEVIDNSAGTTVDLTSMLNREIIENDVWDALIADHSVAGSFGEFIVRRLLTVAKFFSLRT
jgi:hypothetical protein